MEEIQGDDHEEKMIYTDLMSKYRVRQQATIVSRML